MSRDQIILLDSVTKSLEAIIETIETADAMGVYDQHLAESAASLIKTWFHLSKAD